MRHLIVGAGATLAEALALGNSGDACPPVIRDFAKKTWANFAPHPVLEIYLNELGIKELGPDPRNVFFQLEETGQTNIERFMEFCWQYKSRIWTEPTGDLPPGYISGFRIQTPGEIEQQTTFDFWQNFLYHGIGAPIQLHMLQCFWENGTGWRNLELSKTVANWLSPNDLVLNLNYDTVFELALEQKGMPFSYLPNAPKIGELAVCKPHGSLNLVSNNDSFKFGQPDWLGMPQPAGYQSYSGLVPPRLNKRYDQHPISEMIIKPALNRSPDELLFWGVGLTDSDVDLVELYRSWCFNSPSIAVVNPDTTVSEKIGSLLGIKPTQYLDLTTWAEERLR